MKKNFLLFIGGFLYSVPCLSVQVRNITHRAIIEEYLCDLKISKTLLQVKIKNLLPQVFDLWFE